MRQKQVAPVWVLALRCVILGVIFVAIASGNRTLAQTSEPPRQEREASRSFRYTNRLIHEKSPYLQLHAHNPVDWYPWGEEAFTKARREQKPIFLSVGYFTCHWCHVMERESFSNPEIAALLNRWFVSIKVDREERPDIDSEYLVFVEATTGNGGWPMNVFLTPDLKPFFGGTYFPPGDQYGRPGLRTLLPRIADVWRKQRQEILTSADQITQKLQSFITAEAGAVSSIRPAVLDKAYEQIRQKYDAQNGGFGSAPKFPRPVSPAFLLRYWARTGKKDALDMVLNTLRGMASGGIHDHIGGGFHRYSTDSHWHVPHFEKMLYDQAQLASLYAEAYQITHDPFFAGVTRDILDFTLREMRDAGGGFYSALDADSLIQRNKPEHGEGAFYVWTAAEIEHLLGKSDAEIFSYRFGIRNAGNVPQEQDIEGWLKGKNVLYEEHSLSETARKFARSQVEVQSACGGLEAARQKLYAARALRPRPPTDTKVITAWNGLMISALANAGQILNEPQYLEAATQTTSFIRVHLYQPDNGRLHRRYRHGTIGIDGYLQDYAFLIQGLLDLYEASFDVRLLSWAVRLQGSQDRLFADVKQGGYFNTVGSDRTILLRTREPYDGAEPSPNSVAARNLLRLWQITGQQRWKEEADKTLAAFAPQLEKAPESMPYMAAVADFYLARHKQIVIAGAPRAKDTEKLVRLVWQRYLPNRVLMLADGGAGQQQLAQWLPLFAHLNRKQGRATAYICENYVCNLPTSDPQTVAQLLDGAK